MSATDVSRWLPEMRGTALDGGDISPEEASRIAALAESYQADAEPQS